jgi:effector-binding domain-containing protein
LPVLSASRPSRPVVPTFTDPADIDRAYGSLATYVTQHALAVDGPIREYYLVSRHDTADESAWRTEIGWPVFATGTGA